MEQAVRDHGIEATIGEWQVRKPGTDQADPRRSLPQRLEPQGEHRYRGVHRDDPGARQRGREANRDVGGAAAEVHDTSVGRHRVARHELVDEALIDLAKVGSSVGKSLSGIGHHLGFQDAVHADF